MGEMEQYGKVLTRCWAGETVQLGAEKHQESKIPSTAIAKRAKGVKFKVCCDTGGSPGIYDPGIVLFVCVLQNNSRTLGAGKRADAGRECTDSKEFPHPIKMLELGSSETSTCWTSG